MDGLGLEPASPGHYAARQRGISARRRGALGTKARARGVVPDANLPHAVALGRPARDVRWTSRTGVRPILEKHRPQKANPHHTFTKKEACNV
jgi:hypothetical protein